MGKGKNKNISALKSIFLFRHGNNDSDFDDSDTAWCAVTEVQPCTVDRENEACHTHHRNLQLLSLSREAL